MKTLQTLKTFINQRLAGAVEEIFGLLETTISNYEEELDRQRKLLEDQRTQFHVSKTVVKKRDVTLRCLIEYLGESVQELISDYHRTTEDKVHQDLKTQSMKIYICQQPDAVGIIIDGTGLDNMARACCLLLA